ncbi:unnamed protein product [Nippostrongylus brasiliensis]|uniref:Secreted protein n=1 Tax=Nippostrongylus brasiliensis TaxID=27835 RepID=A0A0N4YMK4_NIPBR|nr:unnamed protein product [Nippostrongylus brasiliensis]
MRCMLDSSEIPMFVFPVAVAVRVAPSAKVAGGGAAQQSSVRLDNTLFCHRPMDANSKVTKYLADLNSDGARRSKESSTHINTAALQTLRGPGQDRRDQRDVAVHLDTKETNHQLLVGCGALHHYSQSCTHIVVTILSHVKVHSAILTNGGMALRVVST